MSDLFFKTPEDYLPGETIISSSEIDKRLKELAKNIFLKYKNKKLLLLGLLKGSVWTLVDLMKYLHILGLTDLEIDFIKVKSYRLGVNATHEPKITDNLDLDKFKNRNILLIDDILDTGKTLEFVSKSLQKSVNSLEVLVLLDKPSRREIKFYANYVGFTIPNVWVQGRGMDTDEIGRGDSNIIKGPYKY